MRPVVRGLAIVVAIAFAMFAGWRITDLMQAERYATVDPERALHWRHDDSQALLALAEGQLQDGDQAGAERTARSLLVHAPLEGRAFRVLGEVASRQDKRDQAMRLYLIAARRAPRDIPTRAWLAQRYLEQRDFPQALVHIDYVLRTSPERTKAIYRILKQLAPLAQDELFADALANFLQQDPPWRSQMLVRLRAYPDANSRILQTLQQHGGLSKDEYAGWLDGLMAKGRWGEAYARWASHAVAPGERLPLLYNGGFELTPSDIGFDWRLQRVPGVQMDFGPVTGIQGNVARLQFLDRTFTDAGLQHPLFLFPGRYRFSVKMRARAVHSGLGLHWRIDCKGKAGTVVQGEPLDGSFDWQESVVDFAVPPEKCPAQLLRLVNPTQKGGAQRVEGELWVDDMAIRPLTGS